MTSYGKRAVIYARYSSHNQREESIEIQVQHSRAYCEEHGLVVVGEYCDYAQSGRSADRAEFQRMMADARRGLFDHVVIWKVTRIMRNRDEMSLARLMLRKAGVDILYAGEQVAEGSSGVLQLGMLEVLAEWESELIAERIRDGVHASAKSCEANGRQLFGWDIDPDTKRYVVNEAEARALRTAREMVVGGRTMAEATRALAPCRTKRGVPVTQAALTKMLRRRQNCGTYRYAGVEVEGGMPALWSEAEQDEVERVLANRRRPHRYAKLDQGDYALSGRVVCAECGRRLFGTCGTSQNGSRYGYYRCPDCRRNVRQGRLEGAAAALVRAAVATPEVRALVASLMAEAERADAGPRRSEAIGRELAEIERTYARIWSAIEQGIAPPGGKERIDALQARESALRAEHAKALAEEASLVTEESVVEWLCAVAPEVPDADLLRAFVARAWHSRDGRLAVAMAFDGEPPEGMPEDTDTPEAEAPRVFVNWSAGGGADHLPEQAKMQVMRRCVVLSARV